MIEGAQLISSYTQEQAVDDGYLVKVFEERWDGLSGGKPIMATRRIFDEFSLAALLEIWNAFVVWKTKVEPTLPEEEKMFSTKMNFKKVWVVDDGAAFTMMFPEDY